MDKVIAYDVFKHTTREQTVLAGNARMGCKGRLTR